MEPKELALQLAKQAGKIMKEYFYSGMKKEWKSDNTPVTEADKKINQLVIDEIKKHFPAHGIIAEEESYIKESEFQWVCDPIDGTIPFSSGIPTCAFSLALVKEGEPILGVVYDPFLDRMVIAEKGKGAFLNNEKITVSPTQTLERNLVGLNGYKDFTMKDKTLKGIKLTEEIVKTKARIISQWSIVYPGILVAMGEVACVLARGGHPWDYAAIKVIIEEAGGKTTDLEGKEQRYDQKVNGFLATNRYLHNSVLEIIKKSTQ